MGCALAIRIGLGSSATGVATGISATGLAVSQTSVAPSIATAGSERLCILGATTGAGFATGVTVGWTGLLVSTASAPFLATVMVAWRLSVEYLIVYGRLLAISTVTRAVGGLD